MIESIQNNENDGSINIRIKTMDSNEFKLTVKSSATVNNLKSKIEDVRL